MKIIITGGNGSLGKNITQKLKNNKNYKVFSFDKKSLNIAKYNELKKKILTIKPNLIINAAAYTKVDIAESKKKVALNINYLGVKYLSTICDENNIYLIHISTDFVFNGRKNEPYNEKDKADPISFYGLSKLQGEKIVSEILKNYLILRVSWLFSYDSNNFVKSIYDKCLQGKKINVVADQIGRPTSYDTLTNFILLFLIFIRKRNYIYNGILNFSNLGNFASRYTISKFILSFIKKQKNLKNNNYVKTRIISISSKKLNLPAKRPYNSGLSMNKTSKTIKFKNINWKKSIEKELKKINV